MTLIDTGPIVALFDRADAHHRRCVEALKRTDGGLVTTVPVLTEAFHMLSPASQASRALRHFIFKQGLRVWFLDPGALVRAFELMEQYADHPMDLADASLIAAAEKLDTRRVFTIDRNDFSTYRIKRGYRYYSVELIPN
jgi:uncharacterized protein